MKFTIVERKMKIDDDLRQYALRKVEKLDRYFQQDSDTTLTFSELRGKQTVEITVRQAGLVVRAEETTTDMFASVDGAISSIDLTAADRLEILADNLEKQGIHFYLTEVPKHLEEQLGFLGEGPLIRDEKVLPTVEEAVLEVQKEIEPEAEREAGKETE